MKAPQVRDMQKRKLIPQNQERNRCLKALKLNSKLNYQSWSRLTLGSQSITKVKNRCIVTNRGRAINQAFKLSRLEFCRWAKLSKLPGLEKSSW